MNLTKELHIHTEKLDEKQTLHKYNSLIFSKCH